LPPDEALPEKPINFVRKIIFRELDGPGQHAVALVDRDDAADRWPRHVMRPSEDGVSLKVLQAIVIFGFPSASENPVSVERHLVGRESEANSRASSASASGEVSREQPRIYFR